MLFSCYLIGSCVGSTAGGLKVKRFLTAYKFTVNELRQLFTGFSKLTIVVDGFRYQLRTVGLVIVTMFFYYLLFLVGGIGIILTSPKVVSIEGQVSDIDLVSAFSASIAILGNIGPAAATGTVNSGPTGNYFSFSPSSKLFMTVLMYISRVGVLNILILFIGKKDNSLLKESISELHFESDYPILKV